MIYKTGIIRDFFVFCRRQICSMQESFVMLRTDRSLIWMWTIRADVVNFSKFAATRFGLGITFPSRLIENAVKIGDSTCCCEFQPPTGQLRALFATGYIAGKALRRKRVRRPALTIRIYTRGFRVEIVQDSLRRAIFPCISSVPSRVSSEQD